MEIVLKVEQYLEQAEKKGFSKAEIAKKIGITVYQLNHLTRNDAPKIDRRHLAKFCSFLVDAGLEDRAALPAALFASNPDEFWSMLSRCHRIELCMGVRRDDHWSDQVVIAADSMIQANVLYRLTDAGRAGKRRRQRQIIDQRLVPTWQINGADDDPIRREARLRYAAFQGEKHDKAMVCFGSVKSNPVIELAVASCFKHAKAFKSQDDLPNANKRACPFLFVYRPCDPHPLSCCGGLRLSTHEASEGPGIYYEEADGQWKRAAWDDQSDAALVFYRFDTSRGQVDVVLGGYSGRGTRCLADHLRNKGADDFWPPVISRGGVDIGAFVIRFKFRPGSGGTPSPGMMYQSVSSTSVTPLSENVLEPRLKIPKRSHSPKTARSTVKAKPH